VLGVEQWAEIRRLHFVGGLSIREIARRSGRGRKTIRRALRSSQPARGQAAVPAQTDYRPGELCRFDLWEPSSEIPVGRGQTRRG